MITTDISIQRILIAFQLQNFMYSRQPLEQLMCSCKMYRHIQLLTSVLQEVVSGWGVKI